MGQFYPHSDPTKFIHCLHGIVYVKECGQGTVWDNDKQYCDYV